LNTSKKYQKACENGNSKIIFFLYHCIDRINEEIQYSAQIKDAIGWKKRIMDFTILSGQKNREGRRS
jgi:hypothetical protein